MMFDDGGRAPRCCKCKKITYGYGLDPEDPEGERVICLKCLGI